ncbi:MAG: DUF4115 domain-containing protein, partial [Acidimicrobiales bacterium]
GLHPREERAGRDGREGRPSSHGPRRTTVLAGAGATAVALAAAVTALAIAPGSGPPKAHHDSSGRGAGSHGPTAGGSSPTTSTTQPAVVLPSSQDATLASFSVPAGSFTVRLQATGPCWVEERPTPGGPVVWEGTLAPGQSRSLSASGTLWLRVGDAANAQLSLDGHPVRFDAGGPVPYDFAFTSVGASSSA